MTPQEIAKLVGNKMFAHDSATKNLGIELLDIAPGYARMQMTVIESMVNGHGICHGGYLFLFADSTFAFACNSHGQFSVAAGASIDFLSAVQLGDVLTCEGKQVQQGKRAGVYDMTITDQNQKTVAIFRGRSATIKGNFVE